MPPKPQLRASKLKLGWWIVILPDGSRHGVFSFQDGLTWLADWFHVSGEQWTEADLREREAIGRPLISPVNG